MMSADCKVDNIDNFAHDPVSLSLFSYNKVENFDMLSGCPAGVAWSPPPGDILTKYSKQRLNER